MFNGPIPGESLTIEPGNAPWEQPPQFAQVDEALSWYMDKFEDDENLEDLLWILDNDLPVELFVDTILLTGEMHGKHTTDTSLLIGPVLHEYIKSLADAAGVDYREFQGPTKEEREKEKRTNDVQMHFDAKEALKEARAVVEEAPLEEGETLEITQEVEEEIVPPKMGLMSRRG